MAFKFVTLDVNGTLMKVGRPVGVLYANHAGFFGIYAEPKKLDENFKQTFKEMLKDEPNFGRQSSGYENWWKKLIFTTFQNSSPKEKIDSKKFDKFTDHLIKLFGTKSPWMLLPGAVNMIESLKSAGIPVSIISNTDSRLVNVLNDFELNRYFLNVITSYDVDLMKPDPSIFQYAKDKCEKHLGHKLKEHEIIHVGNSYSLDYIPATKLGWNAAYISDDRKIRLATADNKKLEFSNFTEFTNHLCKIN